MKISFIWLSLVTVLMGLSLAACQKSDSAAQTVEAYLQASTQSDETRMINLSCADWEESARTEADSFRSMNAKLDGVVCQTASGDDSTAIVTCQGKIITAYQGDTREWPLAGREFKLVRQEGEWRMCGYNK